MKEHQLKMCDDKVLKKACKKKYKESSAYQFKKQEKRNQKNYEKKILHKNNFFCLFKRCIIFIVKVIFVIYFILYILQYITR